MWSLKKPKLRFSFLPPPSVRSYKLSSWSWFPPQTLWTITTPALWAPRTPRRRSPSQTLHLEHVNTTAQKNPGRATPQHENMLSVKAEKAESSRCLQEGWARIRVSWSCSPLPPPQVHSKCSLRIWTHQMCVCKNPQQIPLSKPCPTFCTYSNF